jgi:hypothetical protein
VVVATKRQEKHEKCWNEVFFVITLHQENKVLTFKKDKSYDNKDFQCKEDAHEHSCSNSFFIRVHRQCKCTPLREYARAQS